MKALEESCPGPWPAQDGERPADLLARAQAGDAAALNDFVLRYHERLTRVVRIRLGPRGAGLRRFLESTDVVQETWKAALNGIGDLRIQGDAQVLSWLARIATNEIHDLVDRVQAERRSLEREQPLAEASVGHPADSEAGPVTRAALSEASEILDRTLAELSLDYREVILLRDYCGDDWESIAARLGRGSVHAAQQLHQRAWIKVRRLAGPRLGGAGGASAPG